MIFNRVIQISVWMNPKPTWFVFFSQVFLSVHNFDYKQPDTIVPCTLYHLHLFPSMMGDFLKMNYFCRPCWEDSRIFKLDKHWLSKRKLKTWTQFGKENITMVVVLLTMLLANVVHKELPLSANTTHPNLKTTPLLPATHKPKAAVVALDGWLHREQKPPLFINMVS